MIKARNTMNLDGNFSRQFPTPETFTLKSGPQWTIVRRGPRYCNQYEVTEFDAEGLAWLEKHRANAPEPAQ